MPETATSADNWQHIQDTTLRLYAGNSLLLSAGVLAFTALLGISCAWFITTCEFPGRGALSWLLVMPFAMPAYISAMSYGSLLEFAGPIQTFLRDAFGWSKSDYWFPQIRSLGGAMFILGLATLPYIYLMARGAFATQPPEWFDAAQSLGKSRRRLFWHVALPAARPFIAVGLALALMETLADLGAVELLGVPTLANGIYRVWFLLGEPILAAKLASFLLLLVGGLLWIERLSRRGASYHSLRAHGTRPRRRLKPGKGWLVCAWCALPVLLGFLLPLAWLVRMCFYTTETVTLASLIQYTSDSLMLALLATLLVVIAAWVLAFTERKHGSWVRNVNISASLGYAMPGVAIAVGLLVLQGIVKDVTGSNALLTGTLAGLLVAYLVRFLSPAYSALYSGYQRISEQIDMAAISLGKPRRSLLAFIHLPLLKVPMLTASLIVALDVFKELPATLVLRPFDTKTLALAVYEFASDDRAAEAAPYALVMTLIATLAVYGLHRLTKVTT